MFKISKSIQKFLLAFSFFLVPYLSFGQKPMVSFTVTEIKERNRLEFGTTEWEIVKGDEYWTLYCHHPDFDLMTMYFFQWGSTKNIMCTHTSKSDEVARVILNEIIKTHHNLGDNKYLNDNGVLVHYRWEEDLKAHQFMYYNPEGKKSF
jgi:hypothetical protein